MQDVYDGHNVNAYLAWLSWKDGTLSDADVRKAESERWMTSAGFGQMRASDGGLWAKHPAGRWVLLEIKNNRIVSKWYKERLSQ